jgi:hypothetical protein
VRLNFVFFTDSVSEIYGQRMYFRSGTVETMFLLGYCALSLDVVGQRFEAIEWPYIQGSHLTKHAVTERGIPAERSQISCNTVNIHDVTLCSLAVQLEESRRMLIASTDAKSDMLCHISPFCICRFI